MAPLGVCEDAGCPSLQAALFASQDWLTQGPQLLLWQLGQLRRAEEEDHGPLYRPAAQLDGKGCVVRNDLLGPRSCQRGALYDFNLMHCGWGSGISDDSQRAPPSLPLSELTGGAKHLKDVCSCSPGLRSQLGQFLEGMFLYWCTASTRADSVPVTLRAGPSSQAQLRWMDVPGLGLEGLRPSVSLCQGPSPWRF